MVGLFSENPLVGYCLSTPISQTFNLDFSFPFPFTAQKYVLQSLYNLPNTDCYWTYPISWKIYYGYNFTDLKLLDSVNDNTILSKRGYSFEFDVKPFRASVIRFQMVKANYNSRYLFGLSQFDIFGEIESKKLLLSVKCINFVSHKTLVLTTSILLTI